MIPSFGKSPSRVAHWFHKQFVAVYTPVSEKAKDQMLFLLMFSAAMGPENKIEQPPYNAVYHAIK